MITMVVLLIMMKMVIVNSIEDDGCIADTDYDDRSCNDDEGGCVADNNEDDDCER